MDKSQLLRELTTLPEKMEKANLKYLSVLSDYEAVQFKITSVKNHAIHSGKVQGSNEQIRNAALWVEHTKDLEYEKMMLKSECDILKVHVDFLKMRLDSTQLMVKLLD